MTLSATHPGRIAASPVSTILGWMQGRTVTEGWDVVCAIAYNKVNEWFLEQYVDRLSAGEDAVINGSVTEAGGVAIQAVNLTLGPPLINFSPTYPANYVGLTVNFLSGQVNVVQTNAGATNVLSTQVITPGDDYALTGLVPLASVQGEVDNGHDVVINIVNGQSFSARLDLPEGAQTLLGQFMKSWLVDNLKGYTYKLGTLIYGDNGTNLVPAGTFQFATQIDATDATDTGRLLLFIPTTYNPSGGSQTALGLADVVPQGCSTALIISSRALFAGILAGFYTSTFSKFGVQATASQSTPSSAYSLALTAGSVNLGEQSYAFEPNTAFAGTVFSGQTSWGGDTHEPVVVPLSGTQLLLSSNQLHISARLQWPQDLAIRAAAPRSEGVAAWGTVTMTASVTCDTTASVTAVQDTVTLAGTPSISVTFDASSINSDTNFAGDWSQLADQITAAASAALTELFQVPLPQINAFAVSNLLFPGKNILDFQSVYLPGDLVIFGDVAAPGVLVSPGSATLGPGGSQQFSATTSSGEAVTWTATYGTVSGSGLYTAPSTVSQVAVDTVVATGQQSGDAAAALVTMVPQGAQVSPAYTLMQPTTPPQQFSAALSGAPNQDVTWSMTPQVGSLNPAGLYTPPSSVLAPQAVAVTATSPSNSAISGTALVVLAPSSPTLVAVTPSSSALTAGQTQQFKAALPSGMSDTVTWSLLPASAGRITADGLYISPQSIDEPQAVLVMATSTIAPALYGTGLVMLSPGG